MNKDTKQNKTQKIREKVIEANPEIVELKFGCRIEGGGVVMDNGWVYWDTPEGNTCVDNFDFEGEIIGRPIRLADILMAIQGSGKGFWSVSDGGAFVFNGEEDPNIIDVQEISWNLKENTLEWHAKNRPETIDFLYKLLYE